MSEKVIMPREDWVKALDTVREKIGYSTQIKSGDLASAIDIAFDDMVASIIRGSVEVITGNRVTNIRPYAFYSCSALVSANLLYVYSLPEHCFDGCANLTSVTTQYTPGVGAYAFNNCTSLQFLKLIATYVIREGTFNGCSSLNTLVIDYRGTEPPALDNINAFDGTPFAVGGSGGTLYLRENQVEACKVAPNWVDLVNAGTLTILPIEGSEYE